MKLCMITFLLAVSFIAASLDSAYAANPDRLYKDGKYKDAFSAYEKLDIEHPKDITYRYNKGCAAYQLKDYKVAQAAFTSVYQRTRDNDMRYRAVYNLGNTAFQGGDMQSALSCYKEALKMNPQSTDARYNLELALRKIKEEEKKKQEQQQNQQKNQDQKKQDNKQQDQSADNKGNDRQQKDQKKQDNKDQGQNKNQPQQKESQGKDRQQQPQTPQNLSGELKALNGSEQKKGEKNDSKQQQAISPDKAKAEALIGNIQEDRSRFLQHQSPEDKQAGKSGKYW
jgi:Ca-activated chloride channel homolog